MPHRVSCRKPRASIAVLFAVLVVACLVSGGCDRGKQASTVERAVAGAGRGLDKAHRERTLGKLESLRVAFTRYSIDHDGVFPEGSSLAAISAELSPRYLTLLEADDAWGNTMTYASDGRTYSIVSSGPDGVSGTADDLTLRDGNISGGS
jgi:hypothetical protein